MNGHTILRKDYYGWVLRTPGGHQDMGRWDGGPAPDGSTDDGPDMILEGGTWRPVKVHRIGLD